MYWMIIAACSIEVGGSCVMFQNPRPYETWQDCKAEMTEIINSKSFDTRTREELGGTLGAIQVNGVCATDDERDAILDEVDPLEPVI